MPIYVERTHPNVVRSSFVDLPRMDELETYLEWTVTDMKARDGGPIFSLMDIRRAPTPPLEHMKRHAAFFRDHAELIEDTVTGVVFVAQSPMLRGALKALFWMQEPPTPVKVARDLDEALVVLRAWLAEVGITESVEHLDDDPAARGDAIQP